jgi:hypothetical protein
MANAVPASKARQRNALRHREATFLENFSGNMDSIALHN